MMPTETYTETVTKTRNLCDFCGKDCSSMIGNNCLICGRIACCNCGANDGEQLLTHDYHNWLCNKCHELGIVYKQNIRRWKERIVEERKGWRKLGKERAKGGA